jgi:hypothetical protein
MPHESTVRKWALEDRKQDPQSKAEDGFYTQYARARDIGLDAMADELLDIADDGTNDWTERLDSEGKKTGQTVPDHEHIARSRLRVDTRKWYLSKLAPKKYGEAILQKHAGADGETMSPLTVILENIQGKTRGLPCHDATQTPGGTT